jgi:hypothetical protein
MSTVTQKRTRKQAQTIICDFFSPIRKHHVRYKNDTLSYNNKHEKERVDVRGRKHASERTRSSADTKVTNVDLQLIRLEDLNSGQHTNTNTSTSTGKVTKITDVRGTRTRTRPKLRSPVSNTKTNPRLDQEQHYRHIKLSHVSKSAVCGVSPETQHSSIVPSPLTKKRE